MRSSEARGRAFAALLGVAAAGVLGACAHAGVPAQSATCSTPANVPGDVAASVAALSRAAESGAFYAALTAASPLVSCRAAFEGGVMSLRYDLRNGSSLRSTRDPRIEYSEQEARFASELRESPLALLQRVERQSFAPGGCGIAWDKPDEKTQDGESSVEVFRGSVCNCQGRMVRDTHGRVTALVLRSAC